MDFKSVVYTAARDGKLRRLKVQCLSILFQATQLRGESKAYFYNIIFAISIDLNVVTLIARCYQIYK
jgi:hypothetical protein